MTTTDGAPPPGRSRKRVAAGATLLLVVAAIVAAVLATRGGGHATVASRPATAATATVQRRNLVTSETQSGTITYANTSTVANRLAGTLTWVPPVGRVIAPGQKLFNVDNFPVILMDGTTPAYRTLDASDSPGPDIQQLNDNLIHLGFDSGGIVDNDEWQPATTDGVELFQEANGEPETGSLTLGTVVFERGTQRVSGLQGAATSVSDDDVSDQPEFVALSLARPSTTTTARAPTTTTTTATTTVTTTAPATPTTTRTPSSHGTSAATRQANATISGLKSKIGQLQSQQARLGRELSSARAKARAKSAPAPAGPASGGDSPVMTTTSTNLVVTVDVPAGQQGVTHVGARVPVLMPSGSTVHGHVTKIGQATSSGGHSTVPITIHLDRHENGRNLDQATVSVKFVQKTARHVLSVPITALLAQPGGGYAVQTATAPYTLIGVHLGTFATGYVQVSGAGLHPGLRVTDSQG
ncbi:MAG TPA: peptidoglycan-binding domain-containing protein [Solirubrobacteraceae bacterium]|nr:peptidoglycan-binding domain-containing protein [Solirubrobacteraceae bacterium]